MSVRVRVPASSANLGPGYDVFSVALDNPHLTVEAEKITLSEVKVTNTGEYASEVINDPEKHAGARAAKKLLSEKKPNQGIHLKIDVAIPPRKGLGLSGAEAAGAVYAVNHLLHLGLSPEELVHYAATAEPGGHLDNVAASLLGGFTISIHDSLLDRTVVKCIKPPEGLGLVVVVPDISKTSTEDARRAVPEVLGRNKHVEIVGRASLAAVGISTSDIELVLSSVLYDPYVELARADAGVYGHGVDGRALVGEKLELFRRYHVVETISGAGPSRLLWFKISENRGKEGERPVDRAVELVSDNLLSAGHRVWRIFHTGPSASGCQIY
ncbi:MAG: homoserine kinase [Nitrososphaerota archaeon]